MQTQLLRRSHEKAKPLRRRGPSVSINSVIHLYGPVMIVRHAATHAPRYAASLAGLRAHRNFVSLGDFRRPGASSPGVTASAWAHAPTVLGIPGGGMYEWTPNQFLRQ